MAHPREKRVPIADYSKGVNQAPGFMSRARGAAEEMENLVIDLEGRPALRKGYAVVETDGLSIGTEDGKYVEGNQIVVAHWLGDDDVPNGVKRIYYLSRDASWVQDEKGRLIFVVESPPDFRILDGMSDVIVTAKDVAVNLGYYRYFIDVKENKWYEWDNKRYDDPPIISFLGIRHGDTALDELVDYRDEDKIRSEIDVIRNFIVEQPTRETEFRVYLRLELETDIGDLEVYIDHVRAFTTDARQITLYRGPIEQGGYIWYWDGYDDDGSRVGTGGTFQAIAKIHEVAGRSRQKPPGGDDGENDFQVKRPFTIAHSTALNTREKWTVVYQHRFVCATYVNEDFQMESRPSPIKAIPVYDVWNNSSDRNIYFDAQLVSAALWAEAPDWATHIYLYAADGTVPLDYDYDEAAGARASGLVFRRIAKFRQTAASSITTEFDIKYIVPGDFDDENGRRWTAGLDNLKIVTESEREIKAVEELDYGDKVELKDTTTDDVIGTFTARKPPKKQYGVYTIEGTWDDAVIPITLFIGELEYSWEVDKLVGSQLRSYTELVGRGAVLDSYEHDAPDESVHTIGAYGVGLWAAGENRLYFSKIGNLGEQRLYALPSTNALVPHSFVLSKSGQSLIEHIHPEAHQAGLLAFKRDAIHIIKGQGVISGLYNPDTAVTVDVDASRVIEGLGTSSPRTVVTVGTAVYFVGSDKRFYQYAADWRGRTDAKDVGLPIQKYLDAVDDDDLPNLVAYLYRNCYHLVLPDRVILLDMSRKYWTTFSWNLKDAFWSRGGRRTESILYGLRSDGELLELNKSDTDDGDAIGAVWQSNPVPVPYDSVLSGVYAVHTTTPPPTIRCQIKVDDVDLAARDFTPAKSNRFRCGTHAKGSRLSVRLESDDGFPRFDRIEAEIYPMR